ncbi:MAG: cob(I)yrinic acid a,c-diamide adenosyltransferase [Bacilli bacterium]|nr:cob(I)yrinic acid a,c-diamide adenosyltransferase [Bacilli bacterium]
MKIYTKTGDNLTTSAINKRVYKDDLVIHCVGSADELSSSLMVSYHFIENEDIKKIIIEIVKDMFNVSADIIGYKDANSINYDRVERLEGLIDEYTQKMPELTAFIIQGMNKASSHLHLSRSVSRRLERWVVDYAKEKTINKNVLLYLNRLSDLLFTLARFLDQ